MTKYSILVLLVLLSSGCATILNPYNEEFSCPETYNGRCASITEAYEESLSGVTQKSIKENIQPDIYGIDCDDEEDCDEYPEETEVIEANPKNIKPPEPQTAEEEYRQALYDKLANLLKEPTAPMVAEPKVMRVLLLPYEGDDSALYMYRFVYIFAEPPRWILDEVTEKEIE